MTTAATGMRPNNLMRHWMVVGALLTACSSDPVAPTGCVPGASTACVCAGGAAGGQVCQADRTYGVCQCAVTDSGPQADAVAFDAIPLPDVGSSADVGTVSDVQGTPDGGTSNDVMTPADVSCAPGSATCASATERTVCGTDGRTLTTAPCAAAPHASTGCTGEGACVATCQAGYFDCDLVVENGCESVTACTSPLITGLGGTAGIGADEHCVPMGDDEYYRGGVAGGPAVPVTFETSLPTGLNYYGTTYRALFIDNNGSISFGARLMSPRYGALPSASNPAILPWWGDVETSNSGRPTNNWVCFAEQGRRFVVTWKGVGYYRMGTGRRNTFQVALVDRSDVAPGDFDVEFRYERCEWTSADTQGGTNGLGGMPSPVGFDAGDRTRSLTLPGSGTAAILSLCATTNAGRPGLWRYLVRGGVVSAP